MADHREQALSIYRQLLEAWNRRDPDGFAALFGDAGSSIGFDGSQMNGAAEIAATLRSIFADHQTAEYVAKIRDVRSIGTAVTLVRAVVGMVPRGTNAIAPAVNAIQSTVVMMEGGQPTIALLQSTPAAFHGRPHLSEQLTAELTEVLRTGQVIV